MWCFLNDDPNKLGSMASLHVVFQLVQIYNFLPLIYKPQPIEPISPIINLILIINYLSVMDLAYGVK